MSDTATPKEPIPEHYARQAQRLDRALAVVVLVLAFFTASFAARNSDLWLHLATGRLIAEGQYQVGVDPFAFTTQGRYWVNHSWLADWFVYVLAQAGGGPEGTGGTLLVVTKALVITLLAGLLLAIRRPGHGRFLPALCTMLAVIALGPGLELQPVCLSYLFLGLTLYLLCHPPVTRFVGLFRWTDGRPWLLLPLVFALWVNLDRWFFLGPAAVALFLAGQWLPGGNDIGPAARRRLLAVLAVGVLACLLNPHHVWALRLPGEYFDLGLAQVLKTDPVFREFYVAAYQSAYFQPGGTVSTPALAYGLLLVMGVVSFLLLGRTAADERHPWWRYLLWGPLALLSLYYASLVPFFVVVGGPIAALNLQDIAEGTPTTSSRRLGLLVRSMTLIAGLALLFAAWPGWLQPFANDPQRSRRVAWKVVADPSLATPKEPSRRTFNGTPDLANYSAWFTRLPFFCDQRFELYPREVVNAYVDIRRALSPTPGDAKSLSPGAKNWRDHLTEFQIDEVRLHSNGFDNGLPPLIRLLDDPAGEWELVSSDGRTSVFGRAKHAGGGFSFWLGEAEQAAFGPGATRAPPSGPSQPPQPPGFWRLYLDGPLALPAAADESAMNVALFDILGTQARRAEQTRIHLAHLAAFVGSGAQPPGVLSMALQADNGNRFFNLALVGRDLGPPALPLLAVRAGRRAVVEQPDVADGYLRLAEAYQVLVQKQEDQWARTQLPAVRLPGQVLEIQRRQRQAGQMIPLIGTPRPRLLLRHVQLVALWNNVLVLQPDSAAAHLALGDLYWQLSYYDLALDHFGEGTRLLRKAGAKPGESAETFGKRQEAQEKRRADLQSQLAELVKDFEQLTAEVSPTEKARIAFNFYGLAGKAFGILNQADLASFSALDRDGFIYMALTTGHGAELRGVLTGGLRSELESIQGGRADWYQALLAAGAGDYRAAARALDDTMDELAKVGPVRDQARAEFEMIRGLLALEEGIPAEAAEHFERALVLGFARYPVGALLMPGTAPTMLPAVASLSIAVELDRVLPSGFEGRPIARRYLEWIRKADHATRPGAGG